MTLQLSTTVRNALLDSVEIAIGASPVMKMMTGPAPADCATADSGVVIATLNLPADWMANASAGSKALSGTWSDSSADNSGAVGYFRIYASDGLTCHMQGIVTATGGGGDLTLDTVTVTSGEPITITGFTLIAPNA